ncbi:asparagine synthase (glutamine-hydrolyzing) [Lachnospiraceae bacterium MD329]|nr:asparagine synthase (glutamine-hydrolyzing) [Lachnospiraceae bacterium MD329]
MCGICGFINFKTNLVKNENENKMTARRMAEKIRHRGPDSWGEWVGEHAVFAHSRLAVIDVENGLQPMKRTVEGHEFVITYNGELYNTDELRSNLISYGYEFTTTSDTEVLLYAYIHYGEKCAEMLNGIYAFVIWDSMRQHVFACRDRFGVKPFFYTQKGDTIVFASELKSLFTYPEITPTLDKTGLCELFALSPARTQGVGVFKDINELRPARYMIINRHKTVVKQYWSLKSDEHPDNYLDTIDHVRSLVCDTVRRQLVSDVPIATFLSGGLDSSVITAIGAREMAAKGLQLSTYSFDYEDNAKYFKASHFQPDSDTKWVPRMVEEFNTNHTYLVCPNNVLTELLEEALLAKDLPGMADVDASLLYFCREVKKNHTVVLSGECSDEIFGGYPWFREKKAFETPAFPWCYDLSLRNNILLPSVRDTLDLDGYSRIRYDESIAEVPTFDGDNAEEKRRREISYLNINWFMTNLLDRKDRMSMASGLEVRVPFCDHKLVEYVWNIPWEMKNKDNVSKNVLREAAKGILPEDVRLRRKSPYPKTHNPHYETAVKELLDGIISDPNAPILTLCDKEKLNAILNGSSDYGKPFFGQLMAGPQFIGYIVQMNYLLKDYNVRIL